MDDILGLSRPKSEGHSARIKDAVRDHLGVGDDATIMVSELHCHESGCPDVETVISVMSPTKERVVVKIAKPMRDISEEDVFICAEFS